MTGEKNDNNTADTHSNKTDIKENNLTSADNKLDTASPIIKTTKKNRSFLLPALLLIVVTGLAFAGYVGWTFWQAQQQRLQALETDIARQYTQINTLVNQQTTQTDDQRKRLSDLQQEQQLLQQRLDSHTQRLRALAGTSREDWLLAEARYLLRLASQRLLIERSTDSTQSLLEAADNILIAVDDAGILPVRDAIAQEIIALKLAPKIDREGVYLQLSALKQQIQQLPLVPFTPFTKNAPDRHNTISENADNNSAIWYSTIVNSIKKTFSGMKNFIQIRHHDQKPDLLLSEQTQLQIVNNLLLMFEQAQYALLSEEDAIYKNSLEQASDWWEIYYAHYPQYETIKSELGQLQALNIRQRLPMINRSSELLTDYIERFHLLSGSKPLEQTPTEEKSK